MADFAGPLLEACYSVVKTATSLRVFDGAAPQGEAFPYIEMSLVSGIDDSTKCEDGQNIIVRFAVWDRPVAAAGASVSVDSSTITTALGQIYSALHNKALAVAGMTTWLVMFDDLGSVDQPDGVTRMMFNDYRIRLQAV